jgi:hypothetical protein
MRDPWLVAMVVGLVLACLIFAVVWWHIFAGTGPGITWEWCYHEIVITVEGSP